MFTAAHHLSALVPAWLDARLAAGTGLSPHGHDHLPAALLFADLAGFTLLAERLAEQGPAGTERLSRVLNSCFGRLVDEITACGGDVLRFAGDAPIAIFEAADDSAAAMARALTRAAAAGRALQEAMPAISRESGESLSLRVALSAGRLTAVSVGGRDGRCEVVVGGPPFALVTAALAAAERHDVVLSLPAEFEVPGEILVDRLGPGLFRILDVPRWPEAERVHARGRAPAESYWPYVPRGILARVNAGLADWVAELRQASVMFVMLHGVDYEAPSAAAGVRKLFEAIQDAVYRTGGTVNQFVVDDKATTCVAAWGVPTHAHDDDAARALATALEIQSRLAALEARYGIGIATGRIFCGWRGNEQRREYAVIGSTVNFAARLAMARPGGILCDTATREAAGTRIDCRAEGAVWLKGKSHPVETFAPLEVARTPAPRAATTLVGRVPERALFAEALDQLARGEGRTVLLSGEPGAGKSTLLADLIARARAAGVRVAAGAGAPIGDAPGMDVWRGLIEQVLELPPDLSGLERAGALRRRVAGDSYLRDRAPLLAALIGAELPATDLTVDMSGQIRADATRDALLRFLEIEAAASPLLLVMDDTQWIDSLSWGALSALVRIMPRLLVVAGLRVMGEPPQDWHDLRELPGVTLLDLGRLTDEEAVELARRELDVAEMSEAVAAMVRDRTAGHPLFVSELVRWLRDAGALIVANGTCRLSHDLEDLPHELPGSVEGLILGRLDRIDPAHQLTLRVASVIGPTFPVAALLDIHPMQPTAAALAAQLADAERLGFVYPVSGAETVFAFRHALVHDAAYGLTLPTQRATLHDSVAQWLERTGLPPDRPAAVLAHHWTRAEQPLRAIEYLERAGRIAFAQGAARESHRFFRRSLDLAERHALPVDRRRTAGWLQGAAEASLQLGAAASARKDLVSALALLHYDFPASRGSTGRRLAREVVRQTGHLLLPRLTRRPGVDRTDAVATLHMLRSLGAAAFYQADHLTYFTTSLASVNHAEEAGVTEEATMGYTSAAYVASLLKMERLAERWWNVVGEPRDMDQRLSMMVAKGMSLIQQARWNEVEPLLDRLVQQARRLGAHQFLTSGLVSQLIVRYYTRHLDDALDVAFALLESALIRRNDLHELWARQAIAGCLLEKGQYSEAIDHDRRAVELSSIPTDELTKATILGHRIHVALARADLDGAAAHVPELERIVRTSPPAAVATLAPFLRLTRYYLATWARAADRGEPTSALREQARWACGQVGRYAFFFRFARPMHRVIAGEMHDLDGSPRRARRSWRRAMALAEHLKMPAIEAEAAAHLGRHASPGTPEQHTLITRAVTRYRQAGFVAAADKLSHPPAGVRPGERSPS